MTREELLEQHIMFTDTVDIPTIRMYLSMGYGVVVRVNSILGDEIRILKYRPNVNIVPNISSLILSVCNNKDIEIVCNLGKVNLILKQKYVQI